MSAPYRVSHVIFDVDGTLVDWDHSYAAALLAASEEVSGRLGRPVSPSALAQVRELVVAEPAWSTPMLREIRNESFRRVLVAADAYTDETHEAVSSAYFRARDDSLLPFDDVEPVLEELSGRGFTLVAATMATPRSTSSTSRATSTTRISPSRTASPNRTHGSSAACSTARAAPPPRRSRSGIASPTTSSRHARSACTHC